MAKDETGGRSKIAVPYLPFVTFHGTLKGLEQVMPPVIDKSLWATQSGGNQTQLLQAYQFLGLIDAKGAPTTLLHDLVEKKGDELAATYKAIVQAKYPSVLAIPIARATSQQVESTFQAEFAVEGESRRKAISFFQKLAEKAGVAVSPHLKPTRTSVKRPSGPRRGRVTPAARPAPGAPAGDGGGSAQRATVKTVDLGDGGKVSLSVEIADYMSLTDATKTWIDELTKKFKSFPVTEQETGDKE